MTKQTSQLRFLLSLEGTKMVVLNTENDLQIYSNSSSKSSTKREVAAERVTEALLQV